MPDETMKESTYTLERLVERAGLLTEDQVLLYVEGFSRQKLVTIGREVATSRITTDATRLYGTAWDFFARATDAQRRAVMGLSLPLLKAAIWAMARGETLYNQRKASKSGKDAGRSEDVVAAERSRARLVADRNVLIATLTNLAAGDELWLTRLSNAKGTISTPADLTKSVADLSGVARAMLADSSPGMVARCEMVPLEEGWLSALADESTSFLSAAAKATAPTSTATVQQADIDYWDGINLTLLDQVIACHEAGHEKDPSVPRLIPISLRRWFHTPTPKVSGPGDAPTTGEGEPQE